MSSLIGNMIRGAIAGGAATWLMDLVTTGMMDAQSAAITKREKSASPNGQSSVGNLVDRLDEAFGLQLDKRNKGRAASGIHYGLGMVPGALYGAVRHLPLVGAGRGLLYGLILWLVNDEYLNTSLGLAAAPEAYPIETHARGAVGHLVLGAATDLGIDLLGG